jgi:hypothetical protein
VLENMISSAYVMELAVIGGSGGGPFDHRAALEQQGAGTLGCGARGMRLLRLHVEGWAVLSHVKATYALMKDPNGASVAVPATGNVRGRGALRRHTDTAGRLCALPDPLDPPILVIIPLGITVLPPAVLPPWHHNALPPRRPPRLRPRR